MILGRTDSRGRLLFLLLAFVLAAGALIARLGWWQVARATDLADAAQRQIYLRQEIPAQRGTIYDRSGTVILAETATRDRLIADPRRLGPSEREALAAILADVLGLDEAGAGVRPGAPGAGQAVRRRRARPGDRRRRRRSGRGSRRPASAASRSSPESVRVYPQSGGGPDTSLAAHLLGFVNREGQGQYGVEQFYQEPLAGTPAIMESDRDANGQAIVETRHTIDAGTRRDGPEPDDRRRPPARARAGGHPGLGRRPRPERLRGGHGSVHAARSTPRRPTPRTTRTTTRGSPPSTRAGSSTRSSPRSTSRAPSSRCSRWSPASSPEPSRWTRRSTTPARSSSTTAGPRSTTRIGSRWA